MKNIVIFPHLKQGGIAMSIKIPGSRCGGSKPLCFRSLTPGISLFGNINGMD